jgi:hypothetical protein
MDYVLIMTKKGWATFWAIFSQIHLQMTCVQENSKHHSEFQKQGANVIIVIFGDIGFLEHNWRFCKIIFPAYIKWMPLESKSAPLYPLCLSSSAALHFYDYSFLVHHPANCMAVSLKGKQLCFFFVTDQTLCAAIKITVD